MISGPQSALGSPTGQKSVIRGIQVVFSSYVFLDPDLQSPITNRGLDLTKVNGPYLPASFSPIAAGVATTSYNRVTGAYTVTYNFSGPGTEYASLQDGNYTLQFNESAIQGGGPGGPGLSAAGDPYATTAAQFFRLFGDTQGRGEVNNLDTPSDLALMRQALGSVLGGANTAKIARGVCPGKTAI